MTLYDWLSILIIVVCLLLSFFFAGSETALMAFSRARMLRLLGPVLIAIEALVRGIPRAVGAHVGDRPVLSAHEELRGTVDLLHQEGGVEKLDRDMLGGLLDLRDLTVSDVMIHRTEMITVNVYDSAEEVVEPMLAAPVTRLPR